MINRWRLASLSMFYSFEELRMINNSARSSIYSQSVVQLSWEGSLLCLLPVGIVHEFLVLLMKLSRVLNADDSLLVH